MIRRKIENQLRSLAGMYPVVTITGPRQSGKTTLARAVFPDYKYVSLENFDLREAALSDPRGFLNTFSAPVISSVFDGYVVVITAVRPPIPAAHPEKQDVIITRISRLVMNIASPFPDPTDNAAPTASLDRRAVRKSRLVVDDSGAWAVPAPFR